MFEEAQPKFKRLILKIMNLTHDHDTVVIGSEGSIFLKKNSCFIQNYFWRVNSHKYENLIIDLIHLQLFFMHLIFFY